MRPYQYDHEYNRVVGVAFRNMIGSLVNEGATQPEIDEQVGSHVNTVAQAAYDMGVQEIKPSQN